MKNISIHHNKCLFITAIIASSLLYNACESESFEINIPSKNEGQIHNNADEFILTRCTQTQGTVIYKDLTGQPEQQPQGQTGSSQAICKCGENECNPNVACDPNDKTQCDSNFQNASCQTEGSKICSGDGKQLLKCATEENGGETVLKYVVEESCESGKCQNGECVSDNTCSADRCADGKLTKCENSVYTTTSPCENGNSCKSETECGECPNDTIECTNEETGSTEKIGTLKTCKDGIWISKKCENDFACINSTTCAECVDGDTICNNNEDDIGQLLTCNNGVYGSATLCTQPDNVSEYTSCKTEKLCGDCLNGFASCEDNNSVGTLSFCKNGILKTSSCENDNSCKTTTSCGECNNSRDTTVCIDDVNNTGQIYKCNNGRLEYNYTCSNSSCSNATTCGSCRNGTSSCDNKKYKQCVDGGYTNETPCGNNSDCIDETKCATCSAGSQFCINDVNGIGQIKKCNNEGQEITISCQNVSCDINNHECGDCKNGTTSCTNSNTNQQIGRLSTCQNGTIITSVCNNDYSCKSPAECGDCLNGSYSCSISNSTQQAEFSTCSNGQIISATCMDLFQTNSCMTGGKLCTISDETLNDLSYLCVSDGNHAFSFDVYRFLTTINYKYKQLCATNECKESGNAFRHGTVCKQQ